MAIDLNNIPGEVIAFLAEPHLASLTTSRRDGSPHVVAVGFSYDHDEQVVRVITRADSQKAANASRMEQAGLHAAVCQIDNGRWLSLEGPVRLVTDAAGIRAGVTGYANRYREPSERDDRVVIEIAVARMLGRG